jgi:outer membrane lipoprotein SlyB
VNFTSSAFLGGLGGLGAVGGITFTSFGGGGGGGTALFDLVFCAIICVETEHTMNRSISFFIIKFLLRHKDIIIP